jgi:trigger factor
LSSTETIENNSESTHVPDHVPDRAPDREDAEDGHDHQHRHGPVLNPECTRELVIDVPAHEVSAAYRRVTAQYRRYARIPGFRAGKVPESIVRRRYAGEIRREVIDALLPARFNKGVQELGVRPVGQPQVTELTVDDGAPMHVKAVFEYIPEFSIDGYRDVTVPKPSVEVTEEEFQQELEQLRDSRSTMEPVEEDRALADGDFAQISYKGRIEGDPEAEPIAGEDALVEIGGKSTVEAFTTALRGAKARQELKAEVVYPADYAEPRLAGKTVVYELSVKGIKKRNLPELNDEFAKEIGGYESAVELEGAIRERLARRKRRAVENDTREKLLAAIAERFSFPVPESLVQEQIDNRLERGLRALAAQGMAPEAMRRLDFSRLRAAQRDAAVSEVRTQMLLDRIAREENITVTDEELDNELQMASIQTREPLDALKERLTQDGGLGRIREQIRREKTASALYERLPG